MRIDLNGVVDVLVDLKPICPRFESRESHDFFIFFMFFFVIIITVQICKFNITVSTQFLLLYYSLWYPGLQRLQRFDFLLFFCLPRQLVSLQHSLLVAKKKNLTHRHRKV